LPSTLPLPKSQSSPIRIAFCRERLADYKVPDRFVFTTDPLPRNANGKLMKAPLREQARTDAAEDL
jgi:acyl-CoA synthetase (AMP-forming)/AMP-acid ligase II